MDIAFQNPAFLLFLPAVLLLVCWGLYKTTYVTAWRAFCFSITGIGLAIASASPTLSLQNSNTHQIILIDVSDSIRSTSDELKRHVRNLSSHLTVQDTQSVLLFAENSVWVLKRGTAGELNRSLDQIEQHRSQLTLSGTKPVDALQNSLTAVRSPENTNIILLSDGQFSPSQRDKLSSIAKNVDLTVSTKILRDEPLRDVWVDSISSPKYVKKGESFEVKMTLKASGKYEGTIRVSTPNDKKTIQSVPFTIANGQTRTFRTTLNARQNAFQRYEVDVSTNGPEWTEKNNSFHFGVRQSGTFNVLWIGDQSLYKQLSPSLETKRLQFTYKTSSANTDPYNLFIIAGPSSSTSAQWKQRLASTVRDEGSGLIMLGTRDSFGLGNWDGTPIEPLLPVNPFPPDTFSLSMLLDVSGSMSNPPVQTGSSQSSKLTIAKESLSRSLHLLKSTDLLEVITFSQTPNRLRSLKPIGERSSIHTLLSPITAAGETKLLPALEQSLQTLLESRRNDRFIFIYTDGQLSESRSEFKDLAERAMENNIRFVIFSTGNQGDQSLLQLLTSNGDTGRVVSLDSVTDFEAALKDELKRVRQFIHEETTKTKVTAENERVFLPSNPTGIPARTGPYHRVTQKPAARVELRSSHDDVLVAGWQPGNGRTMALTPLYDRFNTLSGDEQNAWIQVLKQSIQWTLPDQPTNWTIRSELTSNRLIMHLEYRGAGKLSSPFIATGRLKKNDSWIRTDVPSTPLSRKHIQFKTPRPPAGSYLFQATIKYNNETVDVTAPVNIPLEREYLHPNPNPFALEAIAKRTGGVPNVTSKKMSNLIKSRPETGKQKLPLRTYLLVLACAGLVLTLIRR